MNFLPLLKLVVASTFCLAVIGVTTVGCGSSCDSVADPEAVRDDASESCKGKCHGEKSCIEDCESTRMSCIDEAYAGYCG